MKIEEKFKNVSITRFGSVYYKKLDAIGVIKQCEDENLILFGIDAFFLTQDTTQPSMENSIYFNDKTAESRQNYKEAKEFLNSRSDDLYFEVVYEEY